MTAVQISVRVSVQLRVSCRGFVSATSFEDVIDFLCFERR